MLVLSMYSEEYPPWKDYEWITNRPLYMVHKHTYNVWMHYTLASNIVILWNANAYAYARLCVQLIYSVSRLWILLWKGKRKSIYLKRLYGYRHYELPLYRTAHSQGQSDVEMRPGEWGEGIPFYHLTSEYTQSFLTRTRRAAYHPDLWLFWNPRRNRNGFTDFRTDFFSELC